MNIKTGCEFLRMASVEPSLKRFSPFANSSVKFSFFDPLFKEEFGGMTEIVSPEKRTLAFYRVKYPDFEYQATNNDLCTLPQVYSFLLRQPKGEAGCLSNFGSNNIFFVKNKKNVIMPVVLPATISSLMRMD